MKTDPTVHYVIFATREPFRFMLRRSDDKAVSMREYILFIMLYADIEGCNHIWLSEETGSIVFDLAHVWHTPLKTSIPAKLKAFTTASKPDMPLTLDEKDLDSCLNKKDFFVNPERFTEKL